MTKPEGIIEISSVEMREFFAGPFASKSQADRAIWYFDRFWLQVAAQAGYAYPAAFPEGSEWAAAHNAAHAQLVADVAVLRGA